MECLIFFSLSLCHVHTRTRTHTTPNTTKHPKLVFSSCDEFCPRHMSCRYGTDAAAKHSDREFAALLQRS